MKILIVGGGGREHAIAWKLSQSPAVEKLYCAPGNPGIAQVAACLPVAVDDLAGIVEAARDNAVDLAVIGPETPLAMGVTDLLEAAGIKTFGPNKNCARLEASKAFTKDFLQRHDIPTARHRSFTDRGALERAIGLFGFPMVLKADGLAAGKGVVIAETEAEAEAAIRRMMEEKAFGAAGEKVVVEEYLQGTEVSALCFVDEKSIVPMLPAQDYKRVFDADNGPNTGGMGTYAPSRVVDAGMAERIRNEILRPTLAGLQRDGLDFKGVLFVGLMITDEGPKVIEFNTRFGDPEAQSVLPLLETDLADIVLAVTENRLSEVEIKWRHQSAVCVMLASEGYPGHFEKGFPIAGLAEAGEDGNALLFHSGTAYGPDGRTIVTAGGRVLGVAALGETHAEARQKAYERIGRIRFPGLHCRTDIGG